jgi:uncharacterized protein involved in exopolysaccharide biosynthesis
MTPPVFPSQVPSRARTPTAVLISAFITVFLLVMITSTAITFILPEAFSSTARVKVNLAGADTGANFLQTEFEVLQSQTVLDKVIEKLNLNEIWGRKYFNGETLKTVESLKILRDRLTLTLVRDTSVIAISVYSDDRREAAQIANTIAGSYREYSLGKQPPVNSVEIIDQAQPASQPCKPNKPLNLAIGAVAGVILGAAVAALVGFFQSRRGNFAIKS